MATVETDGPVVVVLEDCDDPAGAGAYLGEVDGSLLAALRIRGVITNGRVRDGLLAAMLDDTLGPALVATLGPGQFVPITSLHVQFLRPARARHGSAGAAGSSAGQRRGIPSR
jgi:acyl-coenzyme A thioesterase PaaI-like protein